MSMQQESMGHSLEIPLSLHLLEASIKASSPAVWKLIDIDQLMSFLQAAI